MDYGVIASGILKYISSLGEEQSILSNIEFLSNWDTPSSEKTKTDIDDVIGSIKELSSQIELFIEALKLIAECKAEDSKIRSLQAYANSLNYDSKTSDMYTIHKYQAVMRDIATSKNAKKSYLEKAKSTLASISGVSVTTPASKPVISQFDYSDLMGELGTVFSLDDTSSSATAGTSSNAASGVAIATSGAVSSITSYGGGGSSSSSEAYSGESTGPISVTDQKLKKYSTGYTFPLAEGTGYHISSGYGARKSFKTKAGYTSSFHHGIDIAAPAGTAVHAAMEGEVIACGYDNYGAGNFVKIKHPDGKTSVYYHLSSYNVKKGDKINQGDIIAKVGSTGRSTGPHLHFEVRDAKGNSVNPTKYIFV